MTKYKKLMSIISLALETTLTGCLPVISTSSNSTHSNKENIVNIEKLSGQLTDSVERRVNKKAVIRKVDGDLNLEESGDSYVLIYKSETDIELTITLNNPKASEINAVEITCDDPNSEILVDGEYKKIQYKDSEKSETKTRMVNWAQEDPYEKVFKMRTISSDNINTVKIVDLKVNGEWQGEELQNNKLDIYKMDANAYELKVLDNAYGHIDFEFNINDPEKILGNFKLNGNAIADKERFTIDTDSYLNVSYDLIVNEKVVSSRSDEYRYEVRKFGCSKGYTNIDSPNMNLNYSSVLIHGYENKLHIIFNIEEHGYLTTKDNLKFKKDSEYLSYKLTYAHSFGGPNEFYALEFENIFSINTIKNDILNILNNIIIEDQFGDEFKISLLDSVYELKASDGYRNISKIEVIKL